ncbi:uncharacterized protein THITE_2120390 [Thermothielavioides terrestris NRRL 8126]|jgi:hypothetical protein|uniref:Uncharacterized protein n=1 Tax=Thermothielavioides terrestris (strain ATCC 38088 / NRRL 8126) TaxID=578455 RepID=G2RAG9_THETT|nr:uncharacterized protein THITE_2120390 [Thermothielavioides terrestris NRRL 8126]AEO69704.1 hypothetical protein THITE_2120390 [Thermothielavioides terrestris NRRL 8126]
MKAFSVLALFAAVAMAVPAAESVNDLVAQGKLERRSCAANCYCDSGRCYCDNCYPGGCNWYYDGETC